MFRALISDAFSPTGTRSFAPHPFKYFRLPRTINGDPIGAHVWKIYLKHIVWKKWHINNRLHVKPLPNCSKNEKGWRNEMKEWMKEIKQNKNKERNARLSFRDGKHYDICIMLCTFATRGALEPWSGGVPAAAAIRNHMHSSVMLFWRHWLHEGIMTWKFSLHYWPFVRGIHLWVPLTMTRNAVLWWISWWTNNPIQCWWSETPWCSCDNTVVMMTSSNGNIFRVTGHLCGEFTGPRWIPRTKASDAELWCFIWSASE